MSLASFPNRYDAVSTNPVFKVLSDMNNHFAKAFLPKNFLLLIFVSIHNSKALISQKISIKYHQCKREFALILPKSCAFGA